MEQVHDYRSPIMFSAVLYSIPRLIATQIAHPTVLNEKESRCQSSGFQAVDKVSTA